MAELATLEQPPRCSARRFQHVPTIESVKDSFNPQKAALVRALPFAGNRFGHVLFRAQGVRSPAERPDVEDCKYRHLDTQQQSWNANFDIWSLDLVGRLDSAGAGQERDADGLPETQENDQFDGGHLQQRLVLSNVVFNLHIKLDQAIHRNSHSHRLENHDPNMRKGRVERF